MDSDNIRGADHRQDILAETLSEALRLFGHANALIGAILVYLQTKEGRELVARGKLLLNALQSGGALPDEGSYSLPWLALFLNRGEDAVRDQATKRNVPHVKLGDQKLRRASDLTREFGSEAE